LPRPIVELVPGVAVQNPYLGQAGGRDIGSYLKCFSLSIPRLGFAEPQGNVGRNGPSVRPLGLNPTEHIPKDDCVGERPAVLLVLDIIASVDVFKANLGPELGHMPIRFETLLDCYAEFLCRRVIQ
jgi:hypothetical protein